MSVELTILVDNHADEPALRAEHGLAVAISGPSGKRLLFDAGASGETLNHNARLIGFEPESLDGAILSHGHYDHTGGLAAVLPRRRALPLYAHPSAFRRRWVDRPGEPLKDISCPFTLERLRQGGAVFHPIRSPEMLADWLVLSGPIGGPQHNREMREMFVVKRSDELIVDNFEDELFCLIKGQRGWAVLTGCCHRGLRNTLRLARFLARDERISIIVGGLHLRLADDRELHETVDLLNQYGAPEIYPCHCTGEQAIDYLERNLPHRVHRIGAGSRIEL